MDKAELKVYGAMTMPHVMIDALVRSDLMNPSGTLEFVDETDRLLGMFTP